MKAILVIDMPKNCIECEIQCEHCYIGYEDRPSLCPLKPMPEKVEVSDDAMYLIILTLIWVGMLVLMNWTMMMNQTFQDLEVIGDESRMDK